MTKVFLNGPHQSEDTWREIFTEAHLQSFPVTNKKHDHPFQNLWSGWIKGAQGSIFERLDYVGPFVVGEDVPKAYRGTAKLYARALLHSVTLADVVFTWIPEDYESDISISTILGAAASQDFSYDRSGQKIPPKQIITVVESKDFRDYWLVQALSDVTYVHYNPLEIFLNELHLEDEVHLEDEDVS